MPDLLKKIWENPLLMDSQEIRDLVRMFPVYEYGRAWNLYVLALAGMDEAVVDARNRRHPGPFARA